MVSIQTEPAINPDDRILIKLEAICLNAGKHIRYPGFTTIASAHPTNDTKIEFISGVGVIEETGSKVNGYYPGQHVAVCGFMTGEIEEKIITTVSNIAHLSPNISPNYAAVCGFVAGVISTVQKVTPSIGKNVVVAGDKFDTIFYERILDSFGCNGLSVLREDLVTEQSPRLRERVMAFTGGKGADAIIFVGDKVSGNDITTLGNLCHHEGGVVLAGADGISGGSINISCKLVFSNDTGMGAFDQGYMKGQYSYPNAYIQRTTSANLALALQLINENKQCFCDEIKIIDGKADNTCLGSDKTGPLAVMQIVSGTSSAELERKKVLQSVDERQIGKIRGHINKIAEFFRGRLNPCLLQATYRCSEITPSLVREAVVQVSFIIGYEVVRTEKPQDDQDLKTIILCYGEGSVAAIHFIGGFSGEHHEKMEIHCDGLTAICLNRRELEIYTKDSVLRECIEDNQLVSLSNGQFVVNDQKFFKETIASWDQAIRILE